MTAEDVIRRDIAYIAAIAVAVAAATGCGGSLAKPDAGTDGAGDTWSDPCLGDVPIQPVPGMACVYTLPPPPCETTDLMHIGVKVGGTEIPRDTAHREGWDYVDATTVQIYGPDCDAISAVPTVPVTIVFKILV